MINTTTIMSLKFGIAFILMKVFFWNLLQILSQMIVCSLFHMLCILVLLVNSDRWLISFLYSLKIFSVCNKLVALIMVNRFLQEALWRYTICSFKTILNLWALYCHFALMQHSIFSEFSNFFWRKKYKLQ